MLKTPGNKLPALPGGILRPQAVVNAIHIISSSVLPMGPVVAVRGPIRALWHCGCRSAGHILRTNLLWGPSRHQNWNARMSQDQINPALQPNSVFCRAPRFHSCRCPGLQGFRFREFQGSRVLAYQGCGVPSSRGSRFQASRFQTCKGLGLLHQQRNDQGSAKQTQNTI